MSASREPRWPERVRRELEAGRLWRAKDILSGHLRTYGYSPERYEQYGLVLLRMGDDLEAGKYLFLSGIDDPAYSEPVALFLARFGRSRPQLLSSFPASVRSYPMDEFPGRVRDALVARGVPFPSTGCAGDAYRPPGKFAQRLVVVGCFVFLLFSAASAIAGMPVIVRFLVSLLQ